MTGVKLVLSFSMAAVLGTGWAMAAASAVETAAQEIKSRSEMITEVQRALAREGFDPGPIDGVLGPRTRDALHRYQREYQLKETGEINNETLKRLGIDVDEDKGFLDRVGSGAKTVGTAVGNAAVTAGKATAKGVKVAAEKTADASVIGAKATAKGAKVTAQATAKGAKAVAKGTASAAVATKDFVTGADSDDKIKKGVETRLRANPRIADQTDVSVEDGVVTLTFKGGSNDDWNRAVVLAKRESGVKRVYVRMPR